MHQNDYGIRLDRRASPFRQNNPFTADQSK